MSRNFEQVKKMSEQDTRLDSLIDAVVDERVDERVSGVRAERDSTGLTRNEFELNVYCEAVYGCSVIAARKNRYYGYEWATPDPDGCGKIAGNLSEQD